MVYGGDLGYNQTSITMSENIASLDPRVLMIGGDFAYDDGEAACYWAVDDLLTIMNTKINQVLNRLVPMVIAVGNHDIGYSNFATQNFSIDLSGPTYFLYFPQNLPLNDTELRVPTITERTTFAVHLIGQFAHFMLDTQYIAPYNFFQLQWLMEKA